MKTKKLRKLALSLLLEMKSLDNVKVERSLINTYREYDADYDEGVSDRLKKMVLNLIKYNENISINLDENQLSISTNDIGKLKQSFNTVSKYGNDEGFLEIYITKNGFEINYGYRKKASYKDDNIFKELAPIVKKRRKEINFENFDEIWTDIMKVSGAMRDSNLEDLGI